MRRALELLIADELRKTGVITDFQQAVTHMDRKQYSTQIYEKGNTDKYYMVTVIFSNEMVIVYSIDYVDESIKLISKVGFID